MDGCDFCSRVAAGAWSLGRLGEQPRLVLACRVHALILERGYGHGVAVERGPLNLPAVNAEELDALRALEAARRPKIKYRDS